MTRGLLCGRGVGWRGWGAGSMGFWVAMILELNVTAFAGGAGAGFAEAVSGDARVDEKNEMGNSRRWTQVSWMLAESQHSDFLGRFLGYQQAPLKH